MVRKSKRMALYEAIRQGQANIAKGLESGQMRSDGRPKPKERPADDEALLKRKEKSPGITALSKVWAITAGVAALVILLFGVWFVTNLGGSEPPVAGPESDNQSVLTDAPQDTAEPEMGVFSFGRKQTSEKPAAQTAAQPPSAASGQNVIVIQQVPGTNQREKLQPVQDYFNSRGVPTELIQRSGYTLLVTRAGFDHNPNSEGTEGYRLMQRIKQLGLEYPEATGDTSFTRKFQDAYPLKK